MSSPLHEQSSIVNVSECANHLFYLKDFLCGVVVVYAVTSLDLHVLVCLETPRTEVTLVFVLAFCHFGFGIGYFHIGALMNMM